ncbi:hypothetical protein FN846DRAFT_584580 [Sphaerosporella brunnea]|uniref:Uncharacterized protein n=1 Tax=Sphaerosporella brunnea TaxID=1250544 RepID=A0A5J5F1X7_9PEZI|nr:hypothetical protein FN846DRAFT_584580 [Sphaerosporella brunnea]
MHPIGQTFHRHAAQQKLVLFCFFFSFCFFWTWGLRRPTFPPPRTATALGPFILTSSSSPSVDRARGSPNTHTLAHSHTHTFTHSHTRTLTHSSSTSKQNTNVQAHARQPSPRRARRSEVPQQSGAQARKGAAPSAAQGGEAGAQGREGTREV